MAVNFRTKFEINRGESVFFSKSQFSRHEESQNISNRINIEKLFLLTPKI